FSLFIKDVFNLIKECEINKLRFLRERVCS
ncbi:MAG: hypothetical protein ACI9XO_004350, partial [Paraglaciecola sp.]